MKLFFPGGTSVRHLNTFSMLFIFLILIACTPEELPTENMETLAIEIPLNWDSNATSPNHRMEMNEAPFNVVAPVSYCAGENIRLYGTIEGKINRVVDGKGVEHFIRQWTIKGLAGQGWIGPAIGGTSTGTNYDIVGGAEMFVILNPGPFPSNPYNSGKLFIHHGTLVLVNTDTGERLVIKHVINKNPGTGEVTSEWLCMGK
jgi:hypothetical protein